MPRLNCLTSRCGHVAEVYSTGRAKCAACPCAVQSRDESSRARACPRSLPGSLRESDLQASWLRMLPELMKYSLPEDKEQLPPRLVADRARPSTRKRQKQSVFPPSPQEDDNSEEANQSDKSDEADEADEVNTAADDIDDDILDALGL